ncbi:hypothetical protein [Roseimaritima ulvae]|nr:hypothetical protein [Roseimaritima ulvae]
MQNPKASGLTSLWRQTVDTRVDTKREPPLSISEVDASIDPTHHQ